MIIYALPCVFMYYIQTIVSKRMFFIWLGEGVIVFRLSIFEKPKSRWIIWIGATSRHFDEAPWCRAVVTITSFSFIIELP